MAPESHRPERIGEAILRELSALLLRELKDPRLRGVTLTAVRVTNDLRHARVFFSLLGGSEQASAAVDGFGRAAGFIRQRVGRELGLRYAPSFEFEYDPSTERAARISELLAKAQGK